MEAQKKQFEKRTEDAGQKIERFRFALLLVLTFALGMFGSSALQAVAVPVPTQMNYQGRMFLNGGGPVADIAGNTAVFRICTDSGCGASVWSESWMGNVATSSGLFNVILGSNGSPLTLLWDLDYWLEITFNGELMLPRQKLVTAPYAGRAQFSNQADNLTLPLITSGSSASETFEITNTGAGQGIKGISTGGGAGVVGEGQTGTAGVANGPGGIGVLASDGGQIGAIALSLEGDGEVQSGTFRLKTGTVLRVLPGATLDVTGANVVGFPGTPNPLFLGNTIPGNVLTVSNSGAGRSAGFYSSGSDGIYAETDDAFSAGIYADGIDGRWGVRADGGSDGGVVGSDGGGVNGFLRSYGVGGSTGSAGGAGVYGEAGAGTVGAVGLVGVAPIGLSATSNAGGIGVYASGSPALRLDESGRIESATGVIEMGQYVSFTAGTNLNFGVPNPLSLSNTSALPVIQGINLGLGSGVQGQGTLSGVSGSASAATGRGVYGLNTGSQGAGIFGETSDFESRGVKGLNTSGGGEALGVEGQSLSGNGIGVFGTINQLPITPPSGGTGVFGLANAITGRGVLGASLSTAAPIPPVSQRTGVYGFSDDSFGIGVLASNSAVGGRALFVDGDAVFDAAGNTVTFNSYAQFLGGHNISTGVPNPLSLTNNATAAISSFSGGSTPAMYVQNTGAGVGVSVTAASGPGLQVSGAFVAISATTTGLGGTGIQYTGNATTGVLIQSTNNITGQALIAEGSSTLAAAELRNTASGLGAFISSPGPVALRVNNMNFPASDGLSGDVLTTDGFGNLTWTAVSVSAPLSLTHAAASPVFSAEGTGGNLAGMFRSTSAGGRGLEVRSAAIAISATTTGNSNVLVAQGNSALPLIFVDNDGIGTGVRSDSTSGTALLGSATSGTGVSGSGVTGVAGTALGAGAIGVVAQQSGGDLALRAIGNSIFDGAGNTVTFNSYAQFLGGHNISTGVPNPLSVYNSLTSTVIGGYNAGTGAGVYGQGTMAGVSATATGGGADAAGLYGEASNPVGSAVGVVAIATGSPGNLSLGMTSLAKGPGSMNVGVWGEANGSAPQQIGVQGQANQGKGVVGVGVTGVAGTSSQPAGVGAFFENTGGGTALSVTAAASGGPAAFIQNSSDLAIHAVNSSGGGFQPAILAEVQGTNHAVEGRNNFTGALGILGGEPMNGATGVFAGDGGNASNLALRAEGNSVFDGAGNTVTFNSYAQFLGGHNINTSIPVPLSLTGNVGFRGGVISATNTGDGFGVVGYATTPGGASGSDPLTPWSHFTAGTAGYTTVTNSAGVFGVADGVTDSSAGVVGIGTGLGVYGAGVDGQPFSMGGYFASDAVNGTGVRGRADGVGGVAVRGDGRVGGSFSTFDGASSALVVSNSSGGRAISVTAGTSYFAGYVTLAAGANLAPPLDLTGSQPFGAAVLTVNQTSSTNGGYAISAQSAASATAAIQGISTDTTLPGPANDAGFGVIGVGPVGVVGAAAFPGALGMAAVSDYDNGIAFRADAAGLNAIGVNADVPQGTAVDASGNTGVYGRSNGPLPGIGVLADDDGNTANAALVAWGRTEFEGPIVQDSGSVTFNGYVEFLGGHNISAGLNPPTHVEYAAVPGGFVLSVSQTGASGGTAIASYNYASAAAAVAGVSLDLNPFSQLSGVGVVGQGPIGVMAWPTISGGRAIMARASQPGSLAGYFDASDSTSGGVWIRNQWGTEALHVETGSSYFGGKVTAAAGVYSQGNLPGLAMIAGHNLATPGIGVEGSSFGAGTAGVRGSNASNDGWGVEGTAFAGVGVRGEGVTGVAGVTSEILGVGGFFKNTGGGAALSATAANGGGPALYVNNASNLAIHAINDNGGGFQPAILGEVSGSNHAVRGKNRDSGAVGVLGGEPFNNNSGVYGEGPSGFGGYGVHAVTGSPAGSRAFYAEGDSVFDGGSTTFNGHVDFSGSFVTGLPGGTIPNPLSLSNSTAVAVISATNTGSGAALEGQGAQMAGSLTASHAFSAIPVTGLKVSATASAVSSEARGLDVDVASDQDTSTGVDVSVTSGFGNAYGVRATASSSSATSYGVFAQGGDYGVYALASTGAGRGVYGQASNQAGIYGTATNYHGIEGRTGAANRAGVYGVGSGAASPDTLYGVLGEATGTANSDSAGVVGRLDGVALPSGLPAGAGVMAVNARNNGYGIYARAVSPGGVGAVIQGTTIGVEGSAMAGTGLRGTGVTGVAGVTADALGLGGYFENTGGGTALSVTAGVFGGPAAFIQNSSDLAIHAVNSNGGGFQPAILAEAQGTNRAVEGRNTMTGAVGTLGGDLTIGTTGVFAGDGGNSGNLALRAQGNSVFDGPGNTVTFNSYAEFLGGHNISTGVPNPLSLTNNATAAISSFSNGSNAAISAQGGYVGITSVASVSDSGGTSYGLRAEAINTGGGVASAIGIYGKESSNGSGNRIGVKGEGLVGVQGAGITIGVEGQATSSGGYGVYGNNNVGIGVYGTSNSATYQGVYGTNGSSGSNPVAIKGLSQGSASSIGVLGATVGGVIPYPGTTTGVYGYSIVGNGVRGLVSSVGGSGVSGENDTGSNSGAGIFGRNAALNNTGAGVRGTNTRVTGIGVLAENTGGGTALSVTAQAVFSGDAIFNGNTVDFTNTNVIGLPLGVPNPLSLTNNATAPASFYSSGAEGLVVQGGPRGISVTALSGSALSARSSNSTSGTGIFQNDGGGYGVFATSDQPGITRIGVFGRANLGVGVVGTGVTGVAGTALGAGAIGVVAQQSGGSLALRTLGDSIFDGGSTTFNGHVDFSGSTVTGLPLGVPNPLSIYNSLTSTVIGGYNNAGPGVLGQASVAGAPGVLGTSTVAGGVGVQGTVSDGTGVLAQATNLFAGRALVAEGGRYGVSATASSGIGTAVWGGASSSFPAAEFINDGSGTPLKINSMSFPGTDGADKEVLTTDGLGNLSWKSVEVNAPLSLTSGSGASTLYVHNTGTASAVLGEADSAGSYGVFGVNNAAAPGGVGVQGSGLLHGVRGSNNSNNTGATGVKGESFAGSGFVAGVYGEAASIDGWGVRGDNTSGTGVYGSGLTGTAGRALPGGVGVLAEQNTGALALHALGETALEGKVTVLHTNPSGGALNVTNNAGTGVGLGVENIGTAILARNDDNFSPTLDILNRGAGVGLRVNGMNYPASDGAAGEVLSTDGFGNLTWTAAAGGGGGFVSVTSTTNFSPIYGENTSSGPALIGNNTGSGTALSATATTGNAGYFRSAGASGGDHSVEVYNDGVAAAIYGKSAAGNGMQGITDYVSGYGIYGGNTSTSGSGAGVYGTTASSSGYGVQGYNSATTGSPSGVRGMTAAGAGYGVYGSNSVASNNGNGVYGFNSSATGRGIYGNNTSSSGQGIGVMGESNSTGLAAGVYGRALGAGNTGYGVQGYNQSSNGYGVYGLNTAASGPAAGVLGRSNASTEGVGVVGSNSNSLVYPGMPIGVYGYQTGATGVGVYGSGVTGVAGVSSSSQGMAGAFENTATVGAAHALGAVANSSEGFAVVGQNNAAAGAGEAIGVGGFAFNHPQGRGGFFIGTDIGVKGQPWAAGGVGVEANDGGVAGARALDVIGDAIFSGSGNSVTFTTHVDFSGAVVTGLPGGSPPINYSASLPWTGSVLTSTNTSDGYGLKGITSQPGGFSGGPLNLGVHLSAGVYGSSGVSLSAGLIGENYSGSLQSAGIVAIGPNGVIGSATEAGGDGIAGQTAVPNAVGGRFTGDTAGSIGMIARGDALGASITANSGLGLFVSGTSGGVSATVQVGSGPAYFGQVFNPSPVAEFVHSGGGTPLRVNGMNWPNTDGAAGQVLSTDGTGNLTWTAAGVSAPLSLTSTSTATTVYAENTNGGFAGYFNAPNPGGWGMRVHGADVGLSVTADSYRAIWASNSGPYPTLDLRNWWTGINGSAIDARSDYHSAIIGRTNFTTGQAGVVGYFNSAPAYTLPGGAGVIGASMSANSYGVYGKGLGAGLVGESGNTGVIAQGGAVGVSATASSGTGTAIYGRSSSVGGSYTIHGLNDSNGVAVFGQGSGGFGVQGSSAGVSGVYGTTSFNDGLGGGSAAGVRGFANSTTDVENAGVEGVYGTLGARPLIMAGTGVLGLNGENGGVAVWGEGTGVGGTGIRGVATRVDAVGVKAVNTATLGGGSFPAGAALEVDGAIKTTTDTYNEVTVPGATWVVNSTNNGPAGRVVNGTGGGISIATGASPTLVLVNNILVSTNSVVIVNLFGVSPVPTGISYLVSVSNGSFQLKFTGTGGFTIPNGAGFNYFIIN